MYRKHTQYTITKFNVGWEIEIRTKMMEIKANEL